MTAVRGFLAPWIGGAGLPQVEPAYRSLLAYWAGGAVVGQAPVVPPVFSGGGWRAEVPPDLQARHRRKLLNDDELLLLMAAQLTASGILH